MPCPECEGFQRELAAAKAECEEWHRDASSHLQALVEKQAELNGAEADCLSELAQIVEGFDKREGEIVVMSTDTLGVHHDWDVRHEYRQSDGTFVSMRIAIFQHKSDANALAQLLAWRQKGQQWHSIVKSQW